MESPEKDEAQNIVEEIMSKNVSNVMKNYKPIGSRSFINPKHRKYEKPTPKHIIIKLLKTSKINSDKEKILKFIGVCTTCYVQRNTEKDDNIILETM